MNVEVFRDILNICPRIQGQEFDEPPTEEEALSFIRELGHFGEIKYITDVIVDHLHQPWRTFASIINKCLCRKDLAYQIDNIDSKKQDKMYHEIDLETCRHSSIWTNQALLDSVSYKTYYVISSGAEPSKSRKSQKKSDSAILSKEYPSKKKSAKSKKVAAAKPKPTKKKAPVKADRGRGVPNEQHRKNSGIDEGTGTKPRVPNVPKYDSESEKESWGDSGEEDDNDENNFEYENDNDGDDDDDANDDDNQEDDDTYDDDKETNSDRTESDRIKNHVLNQSTMKYYEEE
ncbi:hypothetical protein Tco_1575920 [Tanacetum coccineum]